ncbi:MAG: hypothetical protein MHM6MM_008751 [Cercozoa sp. M6MM]
MDEDAQQLKLGEMFQDVSKSRPLVLSEVYHLLDRLRTARDEDAETGAQTAANKMCAKTLEFCRRASGGRILSLTDTKSMRSFLTNFETRKGDRLETFEAAAFANLRLDSAQEAFTLIPTLRDKFEDEAEMQSFVDQFKLSFGVLSADEE